MPGKLVLVATPIGNVKDLSPRALDVLRESDLLACEDTRHTGRLLTRLGISQTLVSLHEHNERQRVPRLLEAVASGETVALVSDAGTPLLSDPGYVLVREALRSGLVVEHVPGPTAVIAALLLSGLPPYPFTFAGFVPPKPGARRRFFAKFSAFDHTLVFFESPHRVKASLTDAAATFGDRPAALARELTKLHEEVLRGRLDELARTVGNRAVIKGELTLVIGQATSEDSE